MKSIERVLHDVDFFGIPTDDLLGCGQEFRRENMKTLRNMAGVAFVFSFFIGVVPFIILHHYVNAAVIGTYVILTVIFSKVAADMLKKEVIPLKTYYLVHSFNICSYTYGIYVGMTTGRENASIVFVVLLVTLQAFFLIRPRTTFLITLVMSLVFCISSFVMKDHMYFLYDMRNVSLALFISVPMNYVTAKSRVTNIVEKRKTKVAYTRLYDDHLKDSLTGVMTKAVIEEAVPPYCRRCESEGINIFVAIMDVDFFKQYNDTYGHIKGDEVLERIGSILKNIAVTYKINIGRIGGEEFMIVGKTESRQQAESICETIRVACEALGVPHKASDVSETLTVSLGVVYAAAGSEVEPMEIYERADRALYRAKKEGKNRVISI